MITRVIDWKLVTRIAGSVARESDRGTFAGKDIGPVARDAQQRVVAYTGLKPTATLPPPELITRADWIDANVASMRPIFDSLEKRLGDLDRHTRRQFNVPGGALGGHLAGAVLGRAGRAASGAVMSAQLGALTGFLSQRVLGQYDMPLLDPVGKSRLLLVVPNLVQTAERLGVDRDDLLRWVTLHEVTHAVQFSSVPWLRGHLASGLRELLASLEVRVASPPPLRMPTVSELRDFADGARRGELITFVLGRERRELVDRLQCTMAVIEGHAEHVMDAVGAEIIPSQAQLREALERRRATRTTPFRVIERFFGLELKMRQYREGKRFCDEVVARGGIAALDRVWSSPESLPTVAELADPKLWLNRTGVPAVTS
jgi:coenzyme F420 biosynthesis associated uncharacterized protein